MASLRSILGFLLTVAYVHWSSSLNLIIWITLFANDDMRIKYIE